MNKTSISDLKAKAKDQLLGNYGIATGSFALLFVLTYSVMMLITGALSAGNPNGLTEGGLAFRIETQLLGVVVGALTAVFTVGYLGILKEISEGGKPVASDLFFVFRNHPDKVIIVSLVLTVTQFILLLPATYVGGGFSLVGADADFDGKRFLTYVVLYLAGTVVSFFIELMLAMAYMIYLDDPETGVADMMKQSVSMMKGNKFRYFYMMLSFVGYWLLAVLSLGIAALWIFPYQNMTLIEFYKDLKDEN